LGEEALSLWTDIPFCPTGRAREIKAFSFVPLNVTLASIFHTLLFSPLKRGNPSTLILYVIIPRAIPISKAEKI
jgi:hypothetical protein